MLFEPFGLVLSSIPSQYQFIFLLISDPISSYLSDQMQEASSQIFTFTINNKIKVSYRSFALNMYLNFNTAHSKSPSRTNFLINISSCDKQSKINSFGECGLPPKKPGVYLSNIDDCFEFMRQLQKKNIEEFWNEKLSSISHIRQDYFQMIRQIADMKKGDVKICTKLIEILSLDSEKQILILLHTINSFSQEHYRAPKSAMEFALLDYLSNKYELDAFQLIYENPNDPQFKESLKETYSFYTISYTTPQEMLRNAIEHLKYTRFIKIKFDDNISELLSLINEILSYEESEAKIGESSSHLPIMFIIDANCSWKPDVYRKFEEQLENKLIDRIMYIEQPFDFDINDYQEWVQIKKSSKLRILADESMRNYSDIDKVKSVSHAINIKCEKAGGLFGSLRSALVALKPQEEQDDLEVFFGSMVSTQLGCSQTYLLSNFAKYLDVDGSLLVREPVIEGGFAWNHIGEVQNIKQQKIGWGRLVRDVKHFGVSVNQQALKTFFV